MAIEAEGSQERPDMTAHAVPSDPASTEESSLIQEFSPSSDDIRKFVRRTFDVETASVTEFAFECAPGLDRWCQKAAAGIFSFQCDQPCSTSDLPCPQDVASHPLRTTAPPPLPPVDTRHPRDRALDGYPLTGELIGFTQLCSPSVDDMMQFNREFQWYGGTKLPISKDPADQIRARLYSEARIDPGSPVHTWYLVQGTYHYVREGLFSWL